jgi:hypothetical protein
MVGGPGHLANVEVETIVLGDGLDGYRSTLVALKGNELSVMGNTLQRFAIARTGNVCNVPKTISKAIWSLLIFQSRLPSISSIYQQSGKPIYKIPCELPN